MGSRSRQAVKAVTELAKASGGMLSSSAQPPGKIHAWRNGQRVLQLRNENSSTSAVNMATMITLPNTWFGPALSCDIGHRIARETLPGTMLLAWAPLVNCVSYLRCIGTTLVETNFEQQMEVYIYVVIPVIQNSQFNSVPGARLSNLTGPSDDVSLWAPQS